MKLRRKMALTLSVVVACASIPGDGTGGRDDQTAGAVVHNRNRLDMRISIVRSGVPDLLGLVTAGGEQTFVVPADIVGATDLRLRADPVGAHESIDTRTFVLRPGDIVEWTIRERIESSTLIVY